MTFKSGVSFRLKIFCKLKHLAIANAFKRNCFLKSIALRNHWHLSDDVLKALSIFQSTARRNLSHKLDSCFFVIFPSMSKGYFRSDDGMMPSEISFVYCAKHRLVKVHFHSLLQTFSINFTWGWIYFCFLSQTRLENICTTRDLFTFKLKRWRSGCEWQVAEINPRFPLTKASHQSVCKHCSGDELFNLWVEYDVNKVPFLEIPVEPWKRFEN